MSRVKELGKNSFYIMIGTFGSKVIAFLMLPFYTRWLSVEDYGLTDILNVYSSLLVCLLTLSLHDAIFVYPVGKCHAKQALYFSTGLWTILYIFLTSIVITACCMLLFEIHNTFWDNITFLLPMYFFTAVQTYLQQFCRSINKMRTFSYSGIIVTLFIAVFSFLFIPSFGVTGFVIATILSYAISSLFIIYAEKLYHYFIPKGWNRLIFNEMARYAIPLIPNTFMWWVLAAINRPILDSNLGLVGIGLFAVANKFPTLASQVSGIFTGAWQVSVLQEYGRGNFTSFYNKMGNLYVSLLFLLSIIICILSKWLVEITTDVKFHEAWKYVPIMAIAVAFQGSSSHFGTVFSATKKSKYFLISSIVGALVSFVANLLLIPLIGLYGAAFSFTLSQLSIAIIRMYYSNKLIKISIAWSCIMIMLANIICIICVLNNMFIISYAVCAVSFILMAIIYKEKVKSMLMYARSKVLNQK